LKRVLETKGQACLELLHPKAVLFTKIVRKGELSQRTQSQTRHNLPRDNSLQDCLTLFSAQPCCQRLGSLRIVKHDRKHIATD